MTRERGDKLKSGFVTIVGRPSAGKSTLVNALCGAKVAITSPVPQTTRNVVRGIVNRKAGQLIFLDTPGYHESEKKLNIYLKDVVHRALDDADVALYVVDGSRSPGKEEQTVMTLLKKSGLPVVAAVNKIDLSTPRLAEIRGLLLVHLAPKAVWDISAVGGQGLENLVTSLLEACPEGEALYPEEFYTDQDPEFRISEIIREQAINRTNKELPHALYVEIEDMEFQDAMPDGDTEGEKSGTPPRRKLWVRAFLVVERNSQVGILVGKGGEKIKAIRTGAQKELKKIFPWKIRLDLRVKSHPRWRRKDPLLKKMLGSS